MKKKLILILAIVLIILIASGVYILNPFANKIKSGLQVVTHGTSASVFINGQYLDKTPFGNQDILPGTYQLQIIPDDSTLATYELPVTLNRGYWTIIVWNPGKTLDKSGGVVYELEPLSNKRQTEVSIISNPDQALVTFGDYEEKFTPVVLRDVPAGNYDFEIDLVSFDAQQHAVKVVEGHRLNINVKLSRSQLAGLGEDADHAEVEDSEDIEDNDKLENDEPDLSDLEGRQVIQIKSTNFFQDEEEVLRVRQEPSLASQAVGFISANKYYEYLEEKDGWFFIEFIDPTDQAEKQGWVSGEYAEKIQS